MMTKVSERLLSVDEVAARVGISRRTVWRLRDAGVLPPSVKLGGRLCRWRAADIDRWIQAGCPRARKAG